MEYGIYDTRIYLNFILQFGVIDTIFNRFVLYYCMYEPAEYLKYTVTKIYIHLKV